MITFAPVTADDLPEIEKFIEYDPLHRDRTKPGANPKWWLTGISSFVSFRLVDAEGTVCFVRFDREDPSTLRLHAQFGNGVGVTESRVAAAISDAIPRFVTHAHAHSFSSIITESVSERLIGFLCDKLGFVAAGSSDYRLDIAKAAA
jgi:hypothetical protein